MSRIRISKDKTVELNKLWQEWHHSLHSTEITALNEAGRDIHNSTLDFDVDDRLKLYLRSRNFAFEEVPLTTRR